MDYIAGFLLQASGALVLFIVQRILGRLWKDALRTPPKQDVPERYATKPLAKYLFLFLQYIIWVEQGFFAPYIGRLEALIRQSDDQPGQGIIVTRGVTIQFSPFPRTTTLRNKKKELRIFINLLGFIIVIFSALIALVIFLITESPSSPSHSVGSIALYIVIVSVCTIVILCIVSVLVTRFILWGLMHPRSLGRSVAVIQGGRLSFLVDIINENPNGLFPLNVERWAIVPISDINWRISDEYRKSISPMSIVKTRSLIEINVEGEWQVFSSMSGLLVIVVRMMNEYAGLEDRADQFFTTVKREAM